MQKKDKQQGFERMPHKKKGDHKPTRSRGKRKRKKSQTSSSTNTHFRTDCQEKTKEIRNDGDGGK
jgi:hypothetical protein